MNTDTPVIERPQLQTSLATRKQSTSVQFSASEIIQLARQVLSIEADSVSALKERIDAEFVLACKLLLECRGRVVVCGVGKSGHIGNKLAATLASTGTPAFFVHPTEAIHGDFGMIRPEDVVIAISYSGESDELKVLLPLLKRAGNQIIAMTSNNQSSLAKTATTTLNVAVTTEACPLGLAPTSSTTATLAMGDALAIAVLQSRGFSATDFAMSHPAGALGKRLLLQVADIMVSGTAIPQVHPDTLLKKALCEMSAGKLGFLIIADNGNRLCGVFSDGDLRRAMDSEIDINHTTIASVMTPGGHSIRASQLAVDALALLEEHEIYALPVVDDNKTVCGALNMHSLLQAGVV